MDIIFSEFKRKIYKLTDIRRDKYRLSIKVRYPTGENQYDAHEATDDDSLCGMMALFRNLYLFDCHAPGSKLQPGLANRSATHMGSPA